MPTGDYPRSPLSDETKLRISLAKKGVSLNLSEESRRQRSECRKGWKPPAHMLEKAIKVNTGSRRSPESREKLSQNKKLFYMQHPEARRKVSERQSG